MDRDTERGPTPTASFRETLMTSNDTDALLTQIGGDLVSQTATVNNTTIHYVRGGHGPALVLIHGFPQDWSEWRGLIPRLTEHFTVIAVDLRGVGLSAAPPDGYDAASLAVDVAQLVDGLDLGPAHVVGHDIGGWVAYALARRRPDLTSSVVILETLLPGIQPDQAPDIEVPLWHIEFHMIPDLPEALIMGRQATYFRNFLDIGTDDTPITDAEVEHYANAYGDADHLRSAFAVYRAIPANITFNNQNTASIDVPLLLVGGEHVFGPVMPALAQHLKARRHGWTDVQVHISAAGKHYLPEEHPTEIIDLIERHALAR